MEKYENPIIKKRKRDIEKGKIKEKTEKELDEYLKKRGIKLIDWKNNKTVAGKHSRKKDLERTMKTIDKIRKKAGKFNGSKIIREWRDKRYGKNYYNKEKNKNPN